MFLLCLVLDTSSLLSAVVRLFSMRPAPQNVSQRQSVREKGPPQLRIEHQQAFAPSSMPTFSVAALDLGVHTSRATLPPLEGGTPPSPSPSCL